MLASCRKRKKRCDGRTDGQTEVGLNVVRGATQRPLNASSIFYAKRLRITQLMRLSAAAATRGFLPGMHWTVMAPTTADPSLNCGRHTISIRLLYDNAILVVWYTAIAI